MTGDTALYERVAACEARPNRGLVYRSHSLHSAAILPGAALPDDATAGRLTLKASLAPPRRPG